MRPCRAAGLRSCLRLWRSSSGHHCPVGHRSTSCSRTTQRTARQTGCGNSTIRAAQEVAASTTRLRLHRDLIRFGTPARTPGRHLHVHRLASCPQPGRRRHRDEDGYVTVKVPPLTGPIAEFTGSPLSGIEPVTTTFQFVDIRGGTVVYTNYEWDCTSDGTPDWTGATRTTAVCNYPTSGSYDVTLTVTDNTGAQSTLRKNGYVNVDIRSASFPTSSIRTERGPKPLGIGGLHDASALPGTRATTRSSTSRSTAAPLIPSPPVARRSSRLAPDATPQANPWPGPG